MHTQPSIQRSYGLELELVGTTWSIPWTEGWRNDFLVVLVEVLIALFTVYIFQQRSKATYALMY